MHQIKFCVQVGRLHGKAMGLVVTCNDAVVYDCQEVPNDVLELHIESSLPLEIRFETSGKKPDDTLVDDHGNILQDKFLLVDSMAIDDIWIKKWMLESRIFKFVSHSGHRSTSNYFGANGTGTFSIPHKDILDFWLDTLVVDQQD